MALSQWCCHDGIITIMTWSQQLKHLYDGVIVKVSSSWHHGGDMTLQWCCHDGIIAIMMWSQQQKHLYDGIIVKASSSWCHHHGIVTMVLS